MQMSDNKVVASIKQNGCNFNKMPKNMVLSSLSTFFLTYRPGSIVIFLSPVSYGELCCSFRRETSSITGQGELKLDGSKILKKNFI